MDLPFLLKDLLESLEFILSSVLVKDFWTEDLSGIDNAFKKLFRKKRGRHFKEQCFQMHKKTGTHHVSNL